jgi:hypothetical protein
MEALLVRKTFIVKMDNVATSYFSTQLKLSPKQAWWQDFVTLIDVPLVLVKDKSNTREDSLVTLGGLRWKLESD